MRISKHFFIGLISVVFMCAGVGVLSPSESQGQFGGFAPLEQLTESGCVATPAWDEIIEGPARWVAKMDGAAYCDRQTGLVWEAAPGNELLSWSEALEYCLNRTVGENGQLGWRLPEIMELSSLVDKNSISCEEDQLCLPDGHPFQNVRLAFYWSASELEACSEDAQNVFIHDGIVVTNDKIFNDGAWCVRGD